MNVVCGLSSSVIQLVAGWVYDKAGSPIAWTTVIGIGLAELIIIAVMAGFDKKDYPDLQKPIE